MGNCVNACENIIRKQRDLNVDTLTNDNFKNITLTQRMSKQPFYSTIIYLQHQIKKFLKKQKKALKKCDDTTTNLISTTTQRRDNSEIKENQKLTTSGNNNITNNSNNTNTNNNNNNNNNSFVLIPSVKADLKESLIFSNDPFLKGKKANTKTSLNPTLKDPRDGPFDDKRHKFPKILEDESSYEGEWKNGKRDGFGILCWRNVSKFMGEFSEDKVLGFGKLIHEDGDIYTGYWSDFQAQGDGYYKTKKDASYEGYW